MKLAVNYSPQSARLLQRGDISFDLFKCPDWDDLIAEAREIAPLYVHFPLVTGRLSEAAFEGVERLLEQTHTPEVNLHLYARPADLPDVALNTRDPKAIARLTDWLIREVERVTSYFGAERVTAENLIYRGYGLDMLRPVVLPEVIRAVIEATGCGFLLDISHARIAAYHLGVEEPGVEVWDYLQALPVAQLRELHVTGITFQSEKIQDHFGFSETDWDVVTRVFAEMTKGNWAKPGIVAFEYGGIGSLFEWRSKEEVLMRDVPRLLELVRSVS